MAKTVMVPVGEVQKNLFVRETLDMDRAMEFALLMEAGTEFPPIVLAPNKGIIDGRHRLEAHELCKRTEIPAIFVSVEDELEIIGMAYKANAGGSLPPTKADTEHTIALLLKKGDSKKSIGERLGLPPSIARRYIKEVESKLARAKMQRAIMAITEGGLTAAKAAMQYDVDPEKLKEALSGKRRKAKSGVVESQRGLTQRYRSLSHTNSAFGRKVIEQCEDGDITPKQARSLFKKHLDLQAKSTRVVEDCMARFEARFGTKTQQSD